MLYRFGACRLDVERRQLLRDGVDRPLPPKAFDLLRVLIDARPRVLTKEEIMDLVWPDAFVAEANVAVLIGDLRAAIGDSARAPRFIKTSFGVGYSFCGDVAELVRRPSVPILGPLYILSIGERRIALLPGELIIGRDPACDVVLPDGSVSRRHARVRIEGGVADIEDLGSKNGTTLDGRRIEGRARLAHRCALCLGHVQALVEIDRSPDLSTLTIDDGPAPGEKN